MYAAGPFVLFRNSINGDWKHIQIVSITEYTINTIFDGYFHKILIRKSQVISMKYPNKKWLLDALTDLILDENTSQIERNILVSYKRDLENINNDHSIAYHLKQELSLLSMKQQATSNVVLFLSDLSQHYN